jgi:hypothetical protein
MTEGVLWAELALPAYSGAQHSISTHSAAEVSHSFITIALHDEIR